MKMMKVNTKMVNDGDDTGEENDEENTKKVKDADDGDEDCGADEEDKSLGGCW